MTTTTTIGYTRITETGAVEQGVAQVQHDSSRNRPSWADCHRAIPGFFTGKFLGNADSPAVTYTLTAMDQRGCRVERTVGSMRVLDKIARYALREDWTDMAATDSKGRDVTFEVPAFCE